MIRHDVTNLMTEIPRFGRLSDRPFILQTSSFRLHVSDFRLHPSNCTFINDNVSFRAYSMKKLTELFDCRN